MKLFRNLISWWRNLERVNGMLVVRNRIIPFPGYKAIFLFGILFAKPNARMDEQTIRHEAIHAAQYREMLCAGLLLTTLLFAIFGRMGFWKSALVVLAVGLSLFYVWYIAEWLIRLIATRSFEKAYRFMLFEREAYRNQDSETYLLNRKKFNWISKTILSDFLKR